MKTHTLIRFAYAAFITLGAAALTPAFAQESTVAHVDPAFHQADLNHDGRLSRSEIPKDMPLLRTRFSTYDRNQDNELDAQEFTAAQAAVHEGGHAMSSTTPPPQTLRRAHHAGG